ncbi:MAG: hypothetical protein ACXW48_23565, partial [Candidatus Binatia bacterium]
AIGVEKGAETSIYLASAPDIAGMSGAYFIDRRLARSSEASYDEQAALRLWDVSANLTHVVGYGTQADL